MARSKMAKIAVVVVALALLELSCAVVARWQPKAADDDDGGSGDGIPAVMTVNGFKKGESGGGPSACDGRFHGDDEKIVALSTAWFAGGRRCHGRIRITRGGRDVEATVVDECDSRRGCRDNIVDSSPAVWRALGLDTDVGEVRVTWSDA